MQMSRTIQLQHEQVDMLLKEELIAAYKDNLDDPFSPEILDAIEVLLGYYMKPSDYTEWFQNRGRDE